MVSLYVKFLLLVTAFLWVSLCLHWLSWKMVIQYEPNQIVYRRPDEPPDKSGLSLEHRVDKSKCLGGNCQSHSTSVKNKLTSVKPSRIKNVDSVIGSVQRIVKLHQRLDAKLDKLQQMKVNHVDKLNSKYLLKQNKSKEDLHKLKETIQKLGIQHNELTVLSKMGLEVKGEGRVGIWNTFFDQDRILEQMAYVPKLTADDRKKPKGILFDGGFGNWGVKAGQETFKQQKCAIQNCNILDGSPKDPTDVDALLIGAVMYQDVDKYLAEYRRPNVVWVFFALESPMATLDYSSLKNYVNWTATYRRDSTIVAPYEKWVYHKIGRPIDKPKRNYAEGKTKMAAIFLSNCAGSNERLYYIYDMQKNISVDIYGYCGPLKCRRNDKKCTDILNRDYKFYLAFENANCKDYVTEKFFINALKHDVVPVVMGARRKEYEKVAPGNSFIHVEDFKTPEDLATYLHKLDKNDTLYNEYFKWKDSGSTINTKFWCRLCAMLNEPNKPELSVNVEKWWRPKDVCTRGRWDKLLPQNATQPP